MGPDPIQIMRIGIDARPYGPGGVGRYSGKLVTNLEKIDRVNDYFVFLRKENFDLYQPKNPRFHKVLADYSVYSLKEQIFLPFKLCQYHLDLVHFPHFNAPLFYWAPFVVTIHDLIMHERTRQATTRNLLVFYLKKFFYFIVIRNAIRRAQRIIAVSRFTKEAIIKRYKIKPEKIIVTYESA